MEERLYVFDQGGKKTRKTQTYEDIHLHGLLHRTVHVWLINSQKQILLQKRAKNKRAFPSYWDISVAGHISFDETSLQAAKRETKEEIGIKLLDSALILLGTVRQPIVKHSETFIDNEFNDIYLAHCDFLISEFKLQDDEVEEMKWIDKKEFKKWINGEGEILVPHEKEYKILLNYLETH